MAAFAAGFTIISDLDGTLLPAPFRDGQGVIVHPPLSHGPAYAPLVELLRAGATVVGVTGSRFSTHCARFFDEVPRSLRLTGRVLLAVESGARLFSGCALSGEAIEVADYQLAAFGGRRPSLDGALQEELVAIGRAGLRRFYADVLAHGPALLDGISDVHVRGVALDAAPAGATADAPVTLDTAVVPRVEVREGGTAVVFVGVPSRLGARYFELGSARLAELVDGRPTGRLCFDCVPRGLGKAAVVRFLLQSGLAHPGRALCLGDRPLGNDEGLAQWAKPCAWEQLPACVGGGGGPERSGDGVGPLPFFSVAEDAALVPAFLLPLHVSGNARGSAAVLTSLTSSLALCAGSAAMPMCSAHAAQIATEARARRCDEA